MNSPKPRKRLLIEGAVVVLSVLFAFWVEAAWSSRQSRLEEQAALATLLEEATANRGQLERVVELVENDHEAVRSFAEADAASLSSTPPEDADRIIESLWRPNRAALQSGALGGLTMSGQLGVIEDPRLRRLLADWSTEVASLEGRIGVLLELELALQQALGEHSDIQLWLLTTAQPTSFRFNPSASQQTWPESASRGPLDLRVVREDVDVMAAAAVMQFQRRIYLALLDRRMVQLEDLIEALEASLRQR